MGSFLPGVPSKAMDAFLFLPAVMRERAIEAALKVLFLFFLTTLCRADINLYFFIFVLNVDIPGPFRPTTPRPSPFRLSIFELRRQAIAWRSRRRPSKVPFLFPGPSIDSEVWNARRRYVFSFCISSSRDRMKFKLHFLKFPNENADLAPLRPYCAWTANGGGRCECHVRRGVVPFQRGMRELAFSLYFHLKCSSFRARTRPNLHSTLQFSSPTP